MGQHPHGQPVPLPVGAVAPDFTLPSASDAHRSLHGLRGQPVVLVFYPHDWEPVSREQLALYQEYTSDFANYHACLLGISTDHVWSHAAFAHDAHIRFALLADVWPRGAVARAYGVYRARRGVSARALFVVDRSGIVRFGRAYPDALNPGVDGVLTVLETLSDAAMPPDAGRP